MARFTVAREIGAPADAVWAAAVDWPRHGDWVPLTSIRVRTDRPDGVGAEFVARTALGPFGFDDPMRVVTWEPPRDDRPGRCDVIKLGRVVHGRAWFSVLPLSARLSRLTWSEDVTVMPHRVTRLAGPLLSMIGRPGLAATLKALARDVEGPGATSMPY